MKIHITDKVQVQNFGVPFIIAELGSNHNGDMELARKLIKAASEAGADCVKFQSWSKESIFSQKVYEENYFLRDDYRNRTDYTLEEIVEEYSISEKELLEMKSYCDELGIICTSTPFSITEVDFLVNKLASPFVKIASMDLNNFPFLEYIGQIGRPIVLSTGLSQLWEIDRAIEVIESTGNNKIVLLHCVSLYPPKDENVNLERIESLQKIYPYPIGFSDHTLGTCIPLASIAKGACMVEKHFTLDKSLPGWDHKVSASPEEMSALCRDSKRIQLALGSSRIQCLEPRENVEAFRRSIVTTRALKAGKIIEREDLDFKRPGSGLSPGDINFIIGRAIKVDLEKDQLISTSDLV